MLQVSILSVSVSIFNFVSVRLNCQCQFQFRFFVSGFTDIDSKLRYPYLSLSYAPWSEGGCLSSAKLRSTDSVNPRAVLSRVRPRYRLYSKHRDRRCWTGPGIGIRVSFRTFEEPQLFRTTREQESAVGSRPPHLNVALSKAALSGPSVCLRARAPCPLRVTCLRIARAQLSCSCWSKAVDRAELSLWRSSASSSWTTWACSKGCRPAFQWVAPWDKTG